MSDAGEMDEFFFYNWNTLYKIRLFPPTISKILHSKSKTQS